MPGSGPVPQKRDTGAQYGSAPASSGPYMFKPGGIVPGKSAAWVRNPNWDPATDPIRKALPDAINLTVTTNADDMDSRLIAGTADIDVGQSGVQTAARAKILQDPTLKANADTPTTGFLRYAGFATTVAPFNNIDCRKAVIYAADPTSLQTARGGPIAGGDIGTSMLPPNILGSDGSTTRSTVCPASRSSTRPSRPWRPVVSRTASAPRSRSGTTSRPRSRPLRPCRPRSRRPGSTPPSTSTTVRSSPRSWVPRTSSSSVVTGS